MRRNEKNKGLLVSRIILITTDNAIVNGCFLIFVGGSERYSVEAEAVDKMATSISLPPIPFVINDLLFSVCNYGTIKDIKINTKLNQDDHS